MIIRRATPSGRDGVLAIGGFDVDQMLLIDEALVAGHCRVTFDGETIVGYIIVTPRRFFGRDFIDSLGVAVDHRRTGVASMLLEHVLSSAVRTVFTSTNESNSAMRALLDRQGWTFAGSVTGLDEGDPERFYWAAPR
jgi:ribosomal protein S18 acetylase RimI-like enzyme